MSQAESTPESTQTLRLPTGALCWIEIPALDVPRGMSTFPSSPPLLVCLPLTHPSAKNFYASVFGFTFRPTPPAPSPYTEDKIAMFNMPACPSSTVSGQSGGIVKKERKEELLNARCVYLFAEDLGCLSEVCVEFCSLSLIYFLPRKYPPPHARCLTSSFGRIEREKNKKGVQICLPSGKRMQLNERSCLFFSC